MLLTRSLPPQFLLPAWSARQLARASQRAHRSASTLNDHPSQSASRRHRTRDKDSEIFRRPVITDDYLDLTQLEPEPEPEPQQSSEPLSLFDELFPEERQAKTKRERAAEKKLDKLPAFKWNSTFNVGHQEEREREKRREQYKSIPQRDDTPRKEATAFYTPIRLDNPHDVERLRDNPERELRQPTLPSVLVLNACSKTLEESDFFRLGPKGEHIEGWTSGIIKVIPARDNNTLEKLGHYFILCCNDAAARAYLDRTITLHKMARSAKALSSGLPIPPGYLREGEDPEKILQGFTIVPADSKLPLRLLNRPYRPSMIRILLEGGPADRLIKDSTPGEMVMFSVDMGHINQYDLLQALRDDGKRRNLHWKFGEKQSDQIVKLNYAQDDNLGEPEEEVEESPDSEAYRARKKNGYRRPARYVISFKDRNEARRFVREWHRRPFPVEGGHNPGDEPPPIVSAEILW